MFPDCWLFPPDEPQEVDYNLICVVRPYFAEAHLELPHHACDMNDHEWLSRHEMNGQLTYSDPR